MRESLLEFLTYFLGDIHMTVRTVTDQSVTIQFPGYKLDDADAWLETLKENGRQVRGELVKK